VRLLVAIQSCIKENVGRPLVGFLGRIIKNHHSRYRESQRSYILLLQLFFVDFFNLIALETHKGPPYILCYGP